MIGWALWVGWLSWVGVALVGVSVVFDDRRRWRRANVAAASAVAAMAVAAGSFAASAVAVGLATVAGCAPARPVRSGLRLRTPRVPR